MNKILAILFFIQCLNVIHLASGAETSVMDNGDHVLICSQEPIEFGIVLDSSVSIAETDFEKAKDFLVRFLSQFDIGDGENDVRVSIITFGYGIYARDAFNLNTYHDKDGVLGAIKKIPYRAGPRTDTGLAIRYMHNEQLTPAIARPQAEKIGIVITDGNSQSWSTTKREAAKAQADNITMFAIGVGREDQVGMKELLNIAGSDDRVTRVTSFDSLDSIREVLAKKTCIRKEKPTTPAPILDEACGEANPSDIEFFFSPADLGIDASAWTTSFISNVVEAEDMETGIRFGATTGSCPDDSGFNLDAYDFKEDILEHLSRYDAMKLPSLVSMDAFDSSRGGRGYARDVAVVFVNGGKGVSKVEARVQELLDNGVMVFVANPMGYPVNMSSAIALSGRSSRQQAESFIEQLCPST